MKLFFKIVFIISINLVVTNEVYGNDLFVNYLLAYKNLYYKKATKITDEFDDVKLKKVCKNLILVKKNAGQHFVSFNEDEDEKTYNGANKIILLLSKGYYCLYKYPYKIKAYNYFQKAYSLSKEKQDFNELTKICLLAILDVYYYDFHNLNDDCLRYLDVLKQTMTDEADEYYYQLHYLHFYLRSITEKLPTNRFIKSFGEVMKYFDKEHPFFTDYYSSIGICYEYENNIAKAIEFFKKAIQNSKNKDYFKAFAFRSQIHLFRIYRKKKQLETAKNYLKDAEKNIDNADTLASSYTLNIYNSFYNYDKKNYQKAYDLLKTATIQSIELDYKKNSSEIGRLNIQYQTERKEKELLKTKAEKVTTELRLSKQKQFTHSLIASLCFLILIGYLIIQRNKQRLKTEQQQAILREKELGLQAIIQAEENERSRIARELHDGVVQQIGSVILNSRNVLEKLNLLEKPESQELLKSLEDSNQDIRNISHQMMPRALEELGLVQALDDLLNASLPLKGIKINYEHFNINKRLSQKIEKTLYRIVQELTNNILKHSKATEVSVQLFKMNNNIMLLVEDNGVGIQPQKSKGIGLLNINSRLDMVKGTVNYAPSPQSGTLVTIKIPLF